MRSQTKYKKTSGSPIREDDIQAVGNEIENLMREKGGELTPHDVVNHAKSKTSILHDYFEWDNKRASEQFRTWQARKILGSIIEVVVVEKKNQEVRSFFNVKNANEQRVYVTLNTTMTTKNYAQQLLAEAEDYIVHFTKLLKLLRKHI